MVKRKRDKAQDSIHIIEKVEPSKTGKKRTLPQKERERERESN